MKHTAKTVTEQPVVSLFALACQRIELLVMPCRTIEVQITNSKKDS